MFSLSVAAPFSHRHLFIFHERIRYIACGCSISLRAQVSVTDVMQLYNCFVYISFVSVVFAKYAADRARSLNISAIFCDCFSVIFYCSYLIVQICTKSLLYLIVILSVSLVLTIRHCNILTKVLRCFATFLLSVTVKHG